MNSPKSRPSPSPPPGSANFQSQFSVSINWGDGTPADTGANITYDPRTQMFSVIGSHTYAQTGPYSVSVAVTPMTVSIERIDSSDPTNQNIVGDEIDDLNGLSDSPSNDFIDQFVIGATNQGSSLYTFSLPDVATSGGNEALTNSSYSVSEGDLSLSTNGEYLVTAGYNDTVSAWAPQQTFSPATVINRVIGTISGAGVINTTTDLTDAYSGDNFRSVVSTDGTQFWTAGHDGNGATNDYVHYATLGATTSTTLTGAYDTLNPDNINTVEIFANPTTSQDQLYEGVRSAGGPGAPAGIYLIGTVGAGLPTTAEQPETLLIQTPQSDPLDVGASDKPMEPFGFYMANLSDGNPTDPLSGENVAYVADADMGIARYDYSQTGTETSPQWNFSYYIDSTGSYLDSAYSVDSDGNVTASNSFNPNNPATFVDPTKAGGVRELTGRVVTVNGVQQVQLFAVTGFGTADQNDPGYFGSQPNPGGSVIEVTDPTNGNGGTSSYTILATNRSTPTTDPSVLTGIAFTPTQTVTSAAQVAKASPTITASPGATVVLGTGATLTASATLAGGDLPDAQASSITFTLYSPSNAIVYTDVVTVTGNGAYNTSMGTSTGSDVPAQAGTYQWVASYSGDSNNNGVSTTEGSTAEVVAGPGATVVGTTPLLYLYLVGGNTTNDQLNITPIGSNQFGSTGINVNGQLNNVNINNHTYPQAFTAIYVTGFGGNDNFQFAGSLTIPAVISAGNGNDQVQLDNGTNSVTLGNGNDQIQQGGGGTQGGNGNNTIVAGSGNDQVHLGNGSNRVTLGTAAGNGNDQVQLGSGAANLVTLLGNGNEQVQTGAGNETITATGMGNDNIQTGAGNSTIVLGNGNDQVQTGAGNQSITAGNGNDQVKGGAGTDSVTLGNGNDQVQLGDGNNVVTLGNGNDQVQVGNGNNVVVTGAGNDNIQAGNGDNLIAAGLGQHNVSAGNGSNILIDGSVSLTQSGDSLGAVLADWMLYGDTAADHTAAYLASIRAQLTMTDNSRYDNQLQAGSGLDWFWVTYAGDQTNRKATDLLN